MKVLITPRSFAKHSDAPYILLQQNGIDYIRPEGGKILSEEEMKEAIRDVDGIIVGVDPLNAEILKEAKNLKVISKYGVGIDNIDTEYCDAHTIKVTITAGANANAVADYAFALMMAVARRIVEIDQGCRKLDWSKKVSVDIYGKTLGLLGMGNIGKGVAKRAEGFGMHVLAYDAMADETFAKEHHVTYTDLDTVLQESDFISLHLPLTDSTRNIINKEAFSKMKETAILVNTARGGLIQEDDLYEALVKNQIYGAGIDVFEAEPPRNGKLLELPNIVVGSHTAASTIDAVNRMSSMATEHIIKHLLG